MHKKDTENNIKRIKNQPDQQLAVSQTHGVQVFDIIDQTVPGTGETCTSTNVRSWIKREMTALKNQIIVVK